MSKPYGQNVGILWETRCNNVRSTEQNEQIEWCPSVRAIMFKLLKAFRLWSPRSLSDVEFVISRSTVQIRSSAPYFQSLTTFPLFPRLPCDVNCDVKTSLRLRWMVLEGTAQGWMMRGILSWR